MFIKHLTFHNYKKKNRLVNGSSQKTAFQNILLFNVFKFKTTLPENNVGNKEKAFYKDR